MNQNRDKEQELSREALEREVEQQKKIAEVLNNAKKEIELLQEELKAVKKTKKGAYAETINWKS